MSRIEMHNAFFRGQLNGATGSAKFKVTADAINIVDTINIEGGAVTWSVHYTARVPSNPLKMNDVAARFALNVKEHCHVELSASAEGEQVGICFRKASRTDFASFNGMSLCQGFRLGYGQGCASHILVEYTPGHHTVEVYAVPDIGGPAGFESAGHYRLIHLFARYIRKTGG